MNIIIAGGTGFLGQPFCRHLAAAGHRVVVLTRGPTLRAAMPTSVEFVVWTPDGTAGPWAHACEEADAVVNLVGASIGEGRWSPARKVLLRDSRLLATRSLVAALARAPAAKRPRFVSGSAVGYYGNRGNELLTEAAAPGRGFLADLCAAWERAALEAEALGVRVALVRTGLVLARDGGALARMLPPFMWGVGGPLGTGRQYLPWIHRDDWLALVAGLVERPELTGPINATAPEAVTNQEFASALGRAVHRPAWMRAPAFAIRAALGEMGEALLLAGQRVIPERALAAGFVFSHPRLAEALDSIVKGEGTRD
jgi:uncharacterized protein